MKQSFGKIILIIAVAAICLVIAGIITARILFPPAKIKAMVSVQLEKTLGRQVSIGKAGISLFPMVGFSVSDVSVTNSARPGFTKEPFVRFERLLIEVSVASLIKREPEIKKILLKKPQIRIEKDKNGSFNFDDLAVMKTDSVTVKKEEKPAGLPMLPVPISLNLFTIEDGVVVYHDAEAKQDIIIGDLDDRIDFSIDRKLKNITSSGELTCTQVSLKTKELTKPLSNLTVTLSHDIGADLVAGTVQVISLKLSLQKIVLAMTGTVSGLNGKPVFDLGITSESIALQDLIREIPPELVPVLSQMNASGNLQLGLKIKGAVENGAPLPLSGTVTIKDGFLKHKDLPKAVQQITMQCSFTDNSLDIASLKLRCGDNPVALKVKVVDFKKPVIDLKMLADFNLGEVKDFAVLPPGFAFSGKIFADIAAQGVADPADPTKIAVSGKLNLQNASFLTPPLIKPAVVNGSFTLSSQAIAQQLAVVIGSSSMKMDAHVKNYLSFVFPDSTKVLPRPAVQFSVNAPMINVDEFLPPQQDAKTGGQEGDSEKPAAIAPLPGVDVKGSISASKIIFNKIPMSNVSVLVSIINDMVNVSITSGFARGTITEKLAADMRNTNNVSFTNNLAVNRVEISDVFSSFGGFLSSKSALNREIKRLPQSLFGTMNMSSSFSGGGGNPDAILESLKGNLSMMMANGTIKNSLILDRLAGVVEKFLNVHDVRFKDLSTVVKVANGKVIIDQLKMLSDAGEWDATGSVGFDAALAIQVSDRMTRAHSDQLLRLQNRGKGALKGLMQNSAVAQVAGEMIDNVSIPSDNEGRVTLLMNLGGTATDPKASFAGFGKGTSFGTTKNDSPRKKAMEKINARIDNAKAEAQKKLAEERKIAEDAARQKMAQQQQVIEQKRQAVEQKKENVQQELKKNAAGRLKKMF